MGMEVPVVDKGADVAGRECLEDVALAPNGICRRLNEFRGGGFHHCATLAQERHADLWPTGDAEKYTQSVGDAGGSGSSVWNQDQPMGLRYVGRGYRESKPASMEGGRLATETVAPGWTSETAVREAMPGAPVVGKPCLGCLAGDRPCQLGTRMLLMAMHRGTARTARRTASDIPVAALKTGRSRPSPEEPRQVCPKG